MFCNSEVSWFLLHSLHFCKAHGTYHQHSQSQHGVSFSCGMHLFQPPEDRKGSRLTNSEKSAFLAPMRVSGLRTGYGSAMLLSAMFIQGDFAAFSTKVFDCQTWSYWLHHLAGHHNNGHVLNRGRVLRTI